jgi:hypothetical protein
MASSTQSQSTLPSVLDKPVLQWTVSDLSSYLQQSAEFSSLVQPLSLLTGAALLQLSEQSLQEIFPPEVANLIAKCQKTLVLSINAPFLIPPRAPTEYRYFMSCFRGQTSSFYHCRCLHCQPHVDCGSSSDLVHHLIGKHGAVSESLNFDSEAQFLAWKAKYEQLTTSDFVLPRSSHTLLDGTEVKTYCCRRSGEISHRRDIPLNLRAGLQVLIVQIHELANLNRSVQRGPSHLSRLARIAQPALNCGLRVAN